MKKSLRDKVTSETMERYKQMFADAPTEKRFLAEQIYPSAAFFKGVCYELMEEVKANGCIGEMTNGNGIKKIDVTPAYKELKDTAKTLNSCIDSLAKLFPEIKKNLKSESDELLAFIAKGKR